MTSAAPARDTIAAIATAPGAGGVGIVRLSGIQARAIAQAMAGRTLQPRHAHYVRFRDADGETLDDGIALYFAGPASYTGEDVAELQAHGGPALLEELLARACALGARRARPGEFSERAFLEGRLDLAQAEAVADLIAAADARAARAARRALDGEFSRRVEALAGDLLAVRVHVEAAIDFADEPIDTLGGGALRERLRGAAESLEALLVAAERGRRLRDGLVLEAISGYRSHDYQLGIFERKLARGLSVDDILTVNAAPGYSEHHSGLALDIGAPGEPPAEESFELTPAFAWLHERAGGYGFAMSYPRDNPHGIVYEPWHWRYSPA